MTVPSAASAPGWARTRFVAAERRDVLRILRERTGKKYRYITHPLARALSDVPLAGDVLPGFAGDTAYGLVAAAGTPPEWISFWMVSRSTSVSWM